jgi:molybdenum cofactor biosynthesis enzyme MoaA
MRDIPTEYTENSMAQLEQKMRELAQSGVQAVNDSLNQYQAETQEATTATEQVSAATRESASEF